MTMFKPTRNPLEKYYKTNAVYSFLTRKTKESYYAAYINLPPLIIKLVQRISFIEKMLVTHLFLKPSLTPSLVNSWFYGHDERVIMLKVFPFLASQKNFDAEENVSELYKMIHVNNSLATQKNFDAKPCTRLFMVGVNNSLATQRNFDKCPDNSMMEMNPALVTENNFEALYWLPAFHILEDYPQFATEYHFDRLKDSWCRVSMIQSNPTLATQDRFDLFDTDVKIRAAMAKANPKLASIENFNKEKEKSAIDKADYAPKPYTTARKAMVLANHELATEENFNKEDELRTRFAMLTVNQALVGKPSDNPATWGKFTIR